MPAGAQARALLDLWEYAEREHPIDRAMSVLAVLTGMSPSELADEPLSLRDARLLSCRGRLFGEKLVGQAACPGCGCRVEVELAAGELRAAANISPAEGSVDFDGRSIQFRLPTSRDFAAVVDCDGIEQARRLLAERCTGGQVEGEGFVEALEDAMASHAGLAD